MSRRKDIEEAVEMLCPMGNGKPLVYSILNRIWDSAEVAGLRLAARLDHGLRKRESVHTGDWEDGHDLHQEACKAEAKRRSKRGKDN